MTKTIVKQPASQGYTLEQINLIKVTVAKGASDDELKLFLYQAEKSALDPLARQIYCIKRWDSASGKEVMSIMTGIDGFRLVASRTGHYRPDEEPPRYAYDDKGTLYSATVRVFWYHDDTKAWYPVTVTAFYSEYVQTRKDGQPNSMWRKMPHNQLAKCAEALAIRKICPMELSNILTFEEMTAENPDKPAEEGEATVIDPKQLEANNAKKDEMLKKLVAIADKLPNDDVTFILGNAGYASLDIVPKNMEAAEKVLASFEQRLKTLTESKKQMEGVTVVDAEPETEPERRAQIVNALRKAVGGLKSQEKARLWKESGLTSLEAVASFESRSKKFYELYKKIVAERKELAQ
jgi:phage recombination protein Bet